MYHYDTLHQCNEEIDFVLAFLFDNIYVEEKQQHFQYVKAVFENLDLSSQYFLFSLIQERLPRRAKLMFIGEDYIGKKEFILEVMQHRLK